MDFEPESRYPWLSRFPPAIQPNDELKKETHDQERDAGSRQNAGRFAAPLEAGIGRVLRVVMHPDLGAERVSRQDAIGPGRERSIDFMPDAHGVAFIFSAVDGEAIPNVSLDDTPPGASMAMAKRFLRFFRKDDLSRGGWPVPALPNPETEPE